MHCCTLPRCVPACDVCVGSLPPSPLPPAAVTAASLFAPSLPTPTTAAPLLLVLVSVEVDALPLVHAAMLAVGRAVDVGAAHDALVCIALESLVCVVRPQCAQRGEPVIRVTR